MHFRNGVYLFALGFFFCIFTISEFVYAGDSDLDPAFGANGVATVNLGPNYWGENNPEAGDIALQSDGKIVQVGSYLPYYGSDFVLVRYTSTGVLDTSFDSDGKVITDLFSTPTTKYSDDHATSVVIQSDGKIIAAGSSRTDVNGITIPNFEASTAWTWWNVALARYNTDGSLDSGFGTGGRVEIDVANASTADAIYEIALQTDGKIVAVGYTMSGLNNRFLIMRFNSNGTLDTTFNTTGYRIEHFTENTLEHAHAVAVQPDGNIVVAGTGVRPDGKYTISILRLTSAGLLDSTFSGDGKLVQLVGGNSGGYNVVVDSNSKILVGGYTRDIALDTNIFALVRYNSNGTLDTTFDTDGIVSTSFAGTLSSSIRGLVLQADNKIIAYGHAEVGSSDLVIARYNPDGSLDTTFDSGDGMVRTDLSQYDNATNVALQTDGKILASASRRSDDNTYTMLAVLRYGAETVDLTMAVNPAGAGTTTPPAGTSGVLPATPQAISATTNPSYSFVNWTTSGSEAVVANPDAASTTVTLSGNATVTANFCLEHTWHPDGDNDSYGGSLGSTLVQCTQPAGYVTDNTDCNDGDNTIHPGATEIADDGTDQNCNGTDTKTCIVDSDQDGYGTSAGTTILADDGTCDTTQGESATANDCNDTVSSILPGATEIADDGIDQNCNGTDTKTCIVDSDQDGYGISAGTTVLADDGTCDTAQGESTTTGDCNDTNSSIHPGAVEVCDNVDNNCNNNIDEGVTITWYRDNDKDTYGDPGVTTEACLKPTDYVSDNTDCNDTDIKEHPGQTWYKDKDGDGYSDGTTLISCERPADYYIAAELIKISGDPDDNDPNIIPKTFPWTMFLPVITKQKL